MSKLSVRIAMVVCVLALLPGVALGQAVYGSIFGTVTDPSGAAIAGAKVTITSVEKATKGEATTNDAGNYAVTHLIPGRYDVRAEHTGFKAFEAKAVQVVADTSVRVDAQLAIGAVTESVTVTAEDVPQLKTDRADVSTTFNETFVANLPILNRNFTSLVLSMPGTQKLVGWGHASQENPQGSQQIFVAGQHFSGTGYELDGTDNQDPILGIIVINPNLEAVTETKVTLQNFDAEFGKAIAGLVTVQTKSGTNSLHGSAFWFRRTDATFARNPFTESSPNPVTGRLLPTEHWNQFGGSVGGPIFKDKLFFFGDYQGTRQTNGISNQLTIPTARVLSTCLASTGLCDLTQYQPFIGNGRAGYPSNYIYDPLSSTALNGSGRLAFCGATEVAITGTPAINQANCPTPFLIPVGKLSPQALNILKLFPQPTRGTVSNNFVGAGSGPFSQNSFDTRIDYLATKTMHVFGRFSLSYYSVSGKGSLGPVGGVGFGQLGYAGSSIVHNYSLASGFDKAFNPSLLTDFRFGYFKYNPQTHKIDEGTNPATAFGIPNMNLGDVATSGLPAFFMDGTMSSFGDGLGVGRCNCPLTESEQQFQFVNNWTKTKGNHQMKFGADIRFAMNLRIPSDANRTGQLNFNRKGTSNAGTGGLDLATFLLGQVTFMDRYVSSSLDAAERQKRFFFYGQDSFRVTRKFTLTYGLRWEHYFPESVTGVAKGGFANLTDGVVRIAGVGPFGLNGNINNNLTAFAPRVGFAYRIREKTVLRMGYGRSYDMGVFGSNFGHTVTQNLPVLVNQNVSAQNNVNPSASNDIIPAFTLTTGPPLFVFPAIPANGIFPLQGPKNNVSPKIRPTFQRLPSLDAWNATIQHQLTKTMTVEVAYIGNKGSHGFAGNGPAYNANPVAVGPGTSINGTFVPATPQANRRPFFNKFTTIFNGVPVVCCSNDLGNYLANDASSKYNALQVKVERRFSQGLQFVAHYTFSHAFFYDSDYYGVSSQIAYGPIDMTRNHVFVTNVVYELPFGKGKKFASNASRWADLLIGGWQLTSTTNWSRGLAWTPSYGECGQDKDAGPCRPDIGSGSFSTGVHRDATGKVFFFTPIPALAITAPTGTDFCTVARPSSGGFARPECGTIGNVGRNSFRGPRMFLSDLSLLKSFGITERVRGQFRMDTFNVFNHPVMGFNSQQGNTCIDCTGDAGRITDIQGDTGMRKLQFGLRFTF